MQQEFLGQREIIESQFRGEVVDKINDRFQKVDQRFDALENKMDKRFEEVENMMDKRFEEVDKKMRQRLEHF